MISGAPITTNGKIFQKGFIGQNGIIARDRQSVSRFQGQNCGIKADLVFLWDFRSHEKKSWEKISWIFSKHSWIKITRKSKKHFYAMFGRIFGYFSRKKYMKSSNLQLGIIWFLWDFGTSLEKFRIPKSQDLTFGSVYGKNVKNPGNWDMGIRIPEKSLPKTTSGYRQISSSIYLESGWFCHSRI